MDVRGFSSFAKIAESSDAAEFLKTAYLRILDEFVPDADFFKPTGDGLLVLYGYDRESLSAKVRNAVDVAVRLVECFATICDSDPMVNFEVPRNLGIGLARGATTSLISGERVLDYSGRPLNLASRLMDLARPAGVVLDGSFGFELLEGAVQERFTSEGVYVKGIAEDDAITVYYLDGHTEIPAYNKSPMNRLRRFSEPLESITLRDVIERESFQQRLTHKPARSDDIIVHVQYPCVRSNGTKHPKLWRTATAPAIALTNRNQDYAQIDYRPWAEKMKKAGVKPSWPVRIAVEYSVPDVA